MAVILALGVVPAILLIVSFLLFSEFSRAHRQQAELQRSFAAREQVLQVFSVLQDAETGQRGYVITANSRFLEPYASARRRIGRELDELAAYFVDNLEQRDRVTRLRTLSEHKLREMQRPIELVHQGQRADAAAIVAGGRGKAIMDEVRTVVAAMVRAEEAELRRRTDAARASGRRTEFMTAGLSAFLLVLLSAAAWITRRSVQQRAVAMLQLRDTAARQQAILDNTIDAIITLNPSGSIETVNRAAEALFGYDAAELRGRDAKLLLDLGTEAEGSFARRLGLADRAAETGVLRELRATRRDGIGFPADVAIGAMPLPSGRHFVAVVRDISERRRMDEMKTEFISTVSHELRTPLTSISGSLGLVLGGVAGPLSDKLRRLIEIAHNNSKRLIGLINDILDIEKIVSGKISFDLRPVEIRALAERSIEETRAFAEAHGVTLRLIEGPALQVRGDADRLIQVVTNLLSNAAKFSPEGSSVDVEVAQADGAAVLSVRDRGPGIPEEFRSRIFSRFAQADASDRREKGGTGLGLAIVKEIVDRHGGSVWYATVAGQGTTFFVSLPAVAADPDQIPGELQRILICEDDPDTATVLGEMLRAEGFDAVTTSTLTATHAELERGGYAALMLDLQLPDGDGLSFLKNLRRAPKYRELPVIVVTGRNSDDAASSIRALNIVDWINKPLDQDRLQDALQLMALSCVGGCTILHVDDDEDIRSVVAGALSELGEIVSVGTLAEARTAILEKKPDGILLDLDLPDGHGSELLPFAVVDGRPIPVVVFSASEMEDASLGEVAAALTKSRRSLHSLTDTLRSVIKRDTEKLQSTSKL
jgi:PAS domain S-box-containing protein